LSGVAQIIRTALTTSMCTL